MADAEVRRRRRAVLRTHHPDLGGDPEEFIRQVAALDRRPGLAPEVVFVRRPRGLRRITTWLRNRRDRARTPRVR